MNDPTPILADALEGDGLQPSAPAHVHVAGSGRQFALTLGALGVVFGDIGTSPLYAMRETVLATGGRYPTLGRWRTCIYMQLAASALSLARFYHLPPNRVVELGTQVTI